ncbi:MAG: C40 family peptidase [Candidatus Omnitrophica bacterium]|nr:C40 family peptidase [Candidatus Omnitrophota bacterium]
MSCFSAASAADQVLQIVAVPVADLRAEPRGPSSTAHDPLQETQLLYGERVKVITTQAGWAFVEAIEQPEYTHHQRWQGYPGWVVSEALRPSAGVAQPNAVITAKWAVTWQDVARHRPGVRLPMGARVSVTSAVGSVWPVQLVDRTVVWISRDDVRLVQESERFSTAEQRQAIVRAAAEFVGDPYVWGGRSPHAESAGGGVTGVDCSGLVNLAYRSAGLDIPRDAQEQSLRARPIAAPHPADLLFLSAPDNPAKIIHVMLYAGEGQLIEGPGTGLSVHRLAVAERLGRPLEQLKHGDRIGHQTLSFGTYFP